MGQIGENGWKWWEWVKMGYTGGNGSYKDIFCQIISSELKTHLKWVKIVKMDENGENCENSWMFLLEWLNIL